MCEKTLESSGKKPLTVMSESEQKVPEAGTREWWIQYLWDEDYETKEWWEKQRPFPKYPFPAASIYHWNSSYGRYSHIHFAGAIVAMGFGDLTMNSTGSDGITMFDSAFEQSVFEEKYSLWTPPRRPWDTKEKIEKAQELMLIWRCR